MTIHLEMHDIKESPQKNWLSLQMYFISTVEGVQESQNTQRISAKRVEKHHYLSKS